MDAASETGLVKTLWNPSSSHEKLNSCGCKSFSSFYYFIFRTSSSDSYLDKGHLKSTKPHVLVPFHVLFCSFIHLEYTPKQYRLQNYLFFSKRKSSCSERLIDDEMNKCGKNVDIFNFIIVRCICY